MKRMFSFFALITFFFAFTLMAQNYSVDISKIPDGTYKGSQKASVYRYTYYVTVNVRGGKIVSIKTKKYPNNLVKKEAIKIYDKMIKANKVDADGITRATFKAVVYNALTGTK